MTERVLSERHLSFRELLAYVTGWALLAACFTVRHDDHVLTALAIVGLLTLPGTLIAGAIGFVIGGRRLFRSAALCGTSLWILANVVPAMSFFRG